MPEAHVDIAPGTSIGMKLPPVSRKPWGVAVLSLNEPTIWAALLIALADVPVAPGTSSWAKLKLIAYAEEPVANIAVTRMATMKNIVQREFDVRVLSDFVSMIFLPLIYNPLTHNHQIPWVFWMIFHPL